MLKNKGVFCSLINTANKKVLLRLQDPSVYVCFLKVTAYLVSGLTKESESCDR